MTDPSLVSSSPTWASLLAAHIPQSAAEPPAAAAQSASTEQQPEETPAVVPPVQSEAPASSKVRMSPYAPAFYPMGSYAAQAAAHRAEAPPAEGECYDSNPRRGQCKPATSPSSGPYDAADLSLPATPQRPAYSYCNRLMAKQHGQEQAYLATDPRQELEYPPFDEFTRQLDDMGVPHLEYLATLRNLLIRANDMMLPLVQGPYAHMTPIQMANYTTGILETAPLHPSLFMSQSTPRPWVNQHGQLQPGHPHSLTPEDLERCSEPPTRSQADTHTQTDFVCSCARARRASSTPAEAAQQPGESRCSPVPQMPQEMRNLLLWPKPNDERQRRLGGDLQFPRHSGLVADAVDAVDAADAADAQHAEPSVCPFGPIGSGRPHPERKLPRPPRQKPRVFKELLFPFWTDKIDNPPPQPQPSSDNNPNSYFSSHTIILPLSNPFHNVRSVRIRRRNARASGNANLTEAQAAAQTAARAAAAAARAAAITASFAASASTSKASAAAPARKAAASTGGHSMAEQRAAGGCSSTCAWVKPGSSGYPAALKLPRLRRANRPASDAAAKPSKPGKPSKPATPSAEIASMPDLLIASHATAQAPAAVAAQPRSVEQSPRSQPATLGTVLPHSGMRAGMPAASQAQSTPEPPTTPTTPSTSRTFSAESPTGSSTPIADTSLAADSTQTDLTCNTNSSPTPNQSSADSAPTTQSSTLTDGSTGNSTSTLTPNQTADAQPSADLDADKAATLAEAEHATPSDASADPSLAANQDAPSDTPALPESHLPGATRSASNSRSAATGHSKLTTSFSSHPMAGQLAAPAVPVNPRRGSHHASNLLQQPHCPNMLAVPGTVDVCIMPTVSEVEEPMLRAAILSNLHATKASNRLASHSRPSPCPIAQPAGYMETSHMSAAMPPHYMPAGHYNLHSKRSLPGAAAAHSLPGMHGNPIKSHLPHNMQMPPNGCPLPGVLPGMYAASKLNQSQPHAGAKGNPAALHKLPNHLPADVAQQLQLQCHANGLMLPVGNGSWARPNAQTAPYLPYAYMAAKSTVLANELHLIGVQEPRVSAEAHAEIAAKVHAAMPTHMLAHMPPPLPHSMLANVPPTVPPMPLMHRPQHVYMNMPPHMYMNMPPNMILNKPPNMPRNMPPHMYANMPANMPPYVSAGLPPYMPRNMPANGSPHLAGNMPPNAPWHKPPHPYMCSKMPPNAAASLPPNMSDNLPQTMPPHLPDNMTLNMRGNRAPAGLPNMSDSMSPNGSLNKRTYMSDELTPKRPPPDPLNASAHVGPSSPSYVQPNVPAYGLANKSAYMPANGQPVPVCYMMAPRRAFSMQDMQSSVVDNIEARSSHAAAVLASKRNPPMRANLFEMPDSMHRNATRRVHRTAIGNAPSTANQLTNLPPGQRIRILTRQATETGIVAESSPRAASPMPAASTAEQPSNGTSNGDANNGDANNGALSDVPSNAATPRADAPSGGDELQHNDAES